MGGADDTAGRGDVVSCSNLDEVFGIALVAGSVIIGGSPDPEDLDVVGEIDGTAFSTAAGISVDARVIDNRGDRDVVDGTAAAADFSTADWSSVDARVVDNRGDVVLDDPKVA